MKFADLKIAFADRHKDFIIQQLAEMWTVRDMTDNMLREFSAEWGLETDTPEGVKRMTLVRKWLYDRVRYYTYDPRAHGVREEASNRRVAWMKSVGENVREANKSARIQEYARIKEMAIRKGELGNALRALYLIAMEMGQLKFDVKHSGKVEHEHAWIPESRARAELTELFTQELGRSDVAAAELIKLLTSPTPLPSGQGDQGLSGIQEASAEVLPTPPRDPTGNH